MVLTNGIYWHQAPESSEHLRFYDDGRVVAVASPGTPADIAAWFDWDHEAVSKGSFVTRGDAIALIAIDIVGTVAYTGTMLAPGELLLDSHSFINGYDETGVRYEFVELDLHGASPPAPVG